MFTIVNNTGNTVGPYGIAGITISANASTTINSPINSYVADPNLLSDIMNELVSIQIGSNPATLPWDIAVEYFRGLSAKNLNSYQNVVGNSTVTVKTGSGILNWISINNNGTGGTIKIYDSVTASGTLIATITIGTPSGGLLSSSGIQGPDFFGPLNVEFINGLTVVTSGSTSNNITVIYQ